MSLCHAGGGPDGTITLDRSYDTEADMPGLHPDRPAHSLTPGELKRLTYQFIGVDDGYLVSFSRNELDQFFMHLGLDVDVHEMEGTTRERFGNVTLHATPAEQARILRGIVDRCDVGEGPDTRTEQMRAEVLRWASRCDGHMVEPVVPADASATVVRALTDAETLIASTGETSGVDRLHTALHGYLLKAAEAANITFRSDDPSITAAWAQLRAQHPRLQYSGPRPNDIETIHRGLSMIADVLNPLRNRASLAHPNDELLEPDEARLVINVVRTIFGYLEAKLR